jgi:hypothetical protein
MCVVALAGTPVLGGDLAVTANFDNGRIQVVSIEQQTRTICTTVPPDNHAQNPQMRFWRYKITGITPGEELTLEHKPSKPIHHVFSYDGRTWERFPKAGMSGLKFRPEQGELHVCPNIPYPYSRSLRLADELLRLPHVQVSDLAISEEGRAVKMLTITDGAVPDASKSVVWILARQHAFEGPSSLVAEGFAKWAASTDDAAAARFRKTMVAFVVPIMDVDNVLKGMTGKDQPNDFNRVWDQHPAPWNAVRAVQEKMVASASRGRMLALIDSHNPYYDQKPHWHVAARKDAWERFAHEFQSAVTAQGRANWHDMKLEVLEETAPQGKKQGSARAFAFAHWGQEPHFIAATLESAHHKDSEGRFMTETGYLQWGAAIGAALERYARHR